MQGFSWTGLPFHVGLTTRDLPAAMDELARLLGVRWTRVLADPVPGLRGPHGPVDWVARRVHSVAGPLRLELFCGSPGSTWETADDLCLHHLAFWSEDLPGDIERLGSLGWSVELCLADAGGTPAEFCYLVHPEEPRIELVDVRRRAFYRQLIESNDGGGGPCPSSS